MSELIQGMFVSQAGSRQWTGRRVAGLLACGLGLLAVAGCRQRSAVREYTEIMTGAPPASVPAMAQSEDAAATTMARAPLHWTAPAGWQESAGDSMRLATFTVPDAQGTGTCTIVALAGAAGGLEANVRRWIGQLDLPVPPDAEWQAFLKRQESFTTAAQSQGTLVDLTQLPGAEGRTQGSMLAAATMIQDQTVFVKFTGLPAQLQREKARFLELCKSLRAGP